MVEFLLATRTRLVDGLAAEAAQVFDRLVGGLLVRLRLLLQVLHLLLLVVGQHGVVFDVGAHRAALLLANEHL